MGFLEASAATTQAVDLTNVLKTLGDVFKWSINLIVDNPIISMFFFMGLIGSGIGLIRRLKRA